MHLWRVVPISENQMADVDPKDLIAGGHFRLCQTYKGGGGYDQFPYYAVSRGMVRNPDDASRQFVVQLWGCNLDCPYCYVTRAGVWGESVTYSTSQLVYAYQRARSEHDVNVFHLMGGAPALQLKHWPELIHGLGYMFHSDLMLTEGVYDREVLKQINDGDILLAVNIKGTDPEEWLKNTRKELNESVFERNLESVMETLDWRKWYVTFTGVAKDKSDAFLKYYGLEQQDAYNIDIINYNAMPLVDSVPWGRRGLYESP